MITLVFITARKHHAVMFYDEIATPERNLRCAVPRVAVADAEGRSLVPGGETCRVEGAGAAGARRSPQRDPDRAVVCDLADLRETVRISWARRRFTRPPSPVEEAA